MSLILGQIRRAPARMPTRRPLTRRPARAPLGRGIRIPVGGGGRRRRRHARGISGRELRGFKKVMRLLASFEQMFPRIRRISRGHRRFGARARGDLVEEEGD